MKRCQLHDFEHVVGLYEACRAELMNRGLSQWAHGYPKDSIVLNDIKNGELWKLELDELAGVVVLNQSAKQRFDQLSWNCRAQNPLEIHRLAIHPAHQRKGLAKKVMRWAESYAKENLYDCLRLDSWSKNQGNTYLYTQLGYKPTGQQIFWPPVTEPFDCFEKCLD